MFSKNKKSKHAQATQPRAVPSIISADLKIVGDLTSTGEIQVDGEITGDIRSKVLLVGETAVVKGEIRAETVRVHGHVDGQIHATFVNLAKTAHVIGDIWHENLSIQEGAFLEGHIRHMSEGQSKDAKKDSSGNAGGDGASTQKPGEDRVNFVVKAGTPAANAQKKAAEPAPAQGAAKPAAQAQTKSA